MQDDNARPDRERNALADWLAGHGTAVQIAVWVVVIASVGLGAVMWATGRLDVQGVGYAGAFAVNLVGSASILIPLPGIAVVCGGTVEEARLNLVLLALAGGTGSAIGEITGYLAGYSGSALVQRSKHYARLHGWVEHHGAAPLFVLAALPLPLFDVAAIAAGSLGYSLRRFLVVVLAGKVVKYIAVAYACRVGIDWLTELG
ncbi:MAG: VTT domain-containing protein [Chloroflexota bacterium]|nr:VTT domain-containing protein [Chloroflexota bacterium]MDE2969014.1 VTT domain-containing protein [Chloroflexota bacterium]